MTAPHTDAVPFDLTAPLPTGTTVLEASAGTGKTYAIVGLAARFIAEGVPIEALLLVTFSRAATAELRERMRARVAELVVALGNPERGGDSDPLVAHLCGGTRDEVALRRARLIRALSDFDASTIATTHTFCNRMLDALGFLGERELVNDLVEDVDDLAEETARDLYLRGYADGRQPDMSVSDAMTIARDVTRQSAVALSPDDADLAAEPGDDASVAGRRVRFAQRIRDLVDARKRLARVRTYDDLQTTLVDIVSDPEIGEAACERIRAGFRVVLVDEFQDTDPQQWEIVRRCFHGSRDLVLVGDPKQSIYGFRGADVLSYLEAVASAGTRCVLDTNRRSDGALVEGLSRLYGGAELGHPEIAIRNVAASYPGSRISGVPAVRIRAFRRDSFTATNSLGFPSIGDARNAVIADVAADIAGLLSSGTTIEDARGVTRPVTAGDIAILVTANKTIEPLQTRLAGHGVAAVMGAGISVFHTPAARHWLAVLRAIEQPARGDLVRIAALTPLFGIGGDVLAVDDGTADAQLAVDLQDFGRVFDEAGFAAMSQRLMSKREVSARVLGTVGGERLMTDLLQVAALCNAEVARSDQGIGGVSEWLADRIADPVQRQQEQTRRLDRDAHAVQIMTVHKSKGLEFPVVYVPFGWDGTRNNQRATFTFHDDDGVRQLDVGGELAPGHRDRWGRNRSEAAGDDLRSLYVALTRARSQVTIWWAPTAFTSDSSLHRVIFGRSDTSPLIPESVDVPDDDTCVRVLSALADEGRIRVEMAGGTRQHHMVPPVDTASAAELDVARFERVIDQNWRRTSYSAIVAGASHAQTVEVTSGSERPDDLVDDEPVDTAEVVDDPGVAQMRAGVASPMNGMPFGAAFGTLVHEVLEYVDTGAADMVEHVRELCTAAVTERLLDIDIDALTNALAGVLTTPLGFGDLWSIAPRDRLAEMEFEFPLAAAEDATRSVTTAAIADLIDRHLPADDPLAGYSDRLRGLPAQRFRGFLTGSIDSVLRTPQGGFVIVDYKTNRLRPGDLVAEDFDRHAMAAEMMVAHYPLQALLYSVALHRYLRWRLPGYEPGAHLAGAQYHFVRGMVGPETPPGCGVFDWAIPVQLVVELSDLLGEGI